jgi:hypothetical protein
MNVDYKIDAFVRKVNNSPREPLSPDEVPEFLRIGGPDKHGQFMWEIKESNCEWIERWFEAFEQELHLQFPPSFRSLMSRYAFPAFQCGPVFLYANTGDELLSEQDFTWEFKERTFRDKGLIGALFPAGYLQVGNPHDTDYDPICFDTKNRRDDGECPLVGIDHEGILCWSKIRVVKEIASSFLELIEKYESDIQPTGCT